MPITKSVILGIVLMATSFCTNYGGGTGGPNDRFTSPFLDLTPAHFLDSSPTSKTASFPSFILPADRNTDQLARFDNVKVTLVNTTGNSGPVYRITITGAVSTLGWRTVDKYNDVTAQRLYVQLQNAAGGVVEAEWQIDIKVGCDTKNLDITQTAEFASDNYSVAAQTVVLPASFKWTKC